jgi:hypothetical protein
MLLILVYTFFAAINIAEIEARANEILGSIFSKEDAEI